MSNPLVSVCLITYNHEKYIAQAIESVLMQKVDFEWEFIIAEDCSTDNTREILLSYKLKHPSLIKLVLQSKNVGPAQNFLDLFKNAKGKYISYIEGDDYWIDNKKLQKQYDIITNNHSVTICFHNMFLLDGRGEKKLLYDKTQVNPIPNTKTSLKHLFYRNYIPSASAFFVNPNYEKLPEWHNGLFCGDWPMFFDLAIEGDIFYINEPMGVYRVHQNGLYSKLTFYNRIKGTLKVKISFLFRIIKLRKFLFLNHALLSIFETQIILLKEVVKIKFKTIFEGDNS